jgi:hypothetical protein
MDDAKTREGPKAAEPPESSDDMKIMRLGDDNKEAGASLPAEPGDAPQFTKLGEDIGEPGTALQADSPKPTDKREPAESMAPTETKKNVKSQFSLQITQQTWLIAATVLLGLATLFILSRSTGKSKAVEERREERSIESLTPESLIAMCGQPAEDVTKDMYPMIKRTMSYKSGGLGALALEFSRTAEEKSAWVFLSMSDENGVTYSTPDTQIAAMPCLKK